MVKRLIKRAEANLESTMGGIPSIGPYSLGGVQHHKHQPHYCNLHGKVVQDDGYKMAHNKLKCYFRIFQSSDFLKMN